MSAKKTAPVKVNDEITSTEQSRGTHYTTTTSRHERNPEWLPYRPTAAATAGKVNLRLLGMLSPTKGNF